MKPTHNFLERKIGLFPVINIVIANIIGAGIFTTTGYLMEFLDNPIIMLSLWLIGGIIAFCGALAFGELGANFPGPGGEYLFISKLFHPLLGFLSGWLSLIVGFSAPIAASAIGFSKYFLWAFPSFESWVCAKGIINNDQFSKLLAILIVLLFTLLHGRGIIIGTIVQNWLTLLKVTLLITLVILGFTIGNGSYSNFLFNSEGKAISIQNLPNIKSVGLSLIFIMFAFSGWNSATYIGSEIKNPKKNIPASLLLSTIIVTIIYLLVNAFFIYAIPSEKMAGIPEIGGLAAGYAFGYNAQNIISLLISFALFSSLSAYTMLGPRIYYSMSYDGYFFKWTSVIHPRFKVPLNALLLQTAIAIILILSGTFEQIIAYMGFSLGIFPILAVLGVFKLRIKGESKLKLKGYPYAHIFFILANVTILILTYLERPVESSIAIFTALSGIPIFYYFKKKKN